VVQTQIDLTETDANENDLVDTGDLFESQPGQMTERLNYQTHNTLLEENKEYEEENYGSDSDEN